MLINGKSDIPKTISENIDNIKALLPQMTFEISDSNYIFKNQKYEINLHVQKHKINIETRQYGIGAGDT